MGKVPLPKTLEQPFFVLEYDRQLKRYKLTVEGAHELESYNLGEDVQQVMLNFRLWGLEEIGNRAIDMAKEFGIVQAIPREGRVFSLHSRTKEAPITFEDGNATRWAQLD